MTILRSATVIALLLVTTLHVACENKRLIYGEVSLRSTESKDVFVFRVQEVKGETQPKLVPVARLWSQNPIRLDPGKYVLANECSSWPIEVRAFEKSIITLNRLEVAPYAKQAPTPAPQEPPDRTIEQVESASDATLGQDYIPTECIDPVDGVRTSWERRASFDILPGQNTVFIGGRALDLSFPNEPTEPKQVELSSIVVGNDKIGADTRYFILPQSEESTTSGNQSAEVKPAVIPIPAGTKSWLIPGKYQVEINGTRREFHLESKTEKEIFVGVIRIDMPPAFSIAERTRRGGQPVFAYINEGVLFNLNTDYLVFPGEYRVSIEGSELQRQALVAPNQTTTVKTLAARIDVPPCPEDNKTCRFPSKLTIHSEQKPYPLLDVEPGVPFLVFDETYEYGVEGTRGVLRSLPTGYDVLRPEKLGRLRLNWEVRATPNRARTDLVRLEAHGAPVFGRSLDFLFTRPREIYAPPGPWLLSYFVGDPSTERVKTKIEVNLTEGENHAVTIPLYYDRQGDKKESQEEEKESEIEPQKGKGEQNTLPDRLLPLRK